jgi:tetratricopeptide (TPR) repeat protein
MSPASRCSRFFLLALTVGIFLPLSQALAQLGPYPIVTKQAEFEAKIFKRDGEILWVQRGDSPQIGIAISDVLGIKMPRPSLFKAAEKIRTSPKATDAQFKAAHKALDKMILQLKSLRDIPGIPANEAILLKARLYDAKNLWRESTRLYEDLLLKVPEGDLTTQARILAGIAYAQGEEWHTTIEYLGGVDLPEEDEEMLSKLLFGLGNAYYALENYDNALLSYLPLVVFYPYVHDNEPRGMAAALGCYANLGEWEPLYRTIQEIKKNYPNTPAEKTADQFIEDYRDDLINAGQFMDGAEVVEESEDDTPAAEASDKDAEAAK